MSLTMQTIVLRFTSTFLFLSVLLISVVSAATERHTVYRWTDESGQVHFGDSQVLQKENREGEALSLQTNIMKSIPATDVVNRKSPDTENKIKWKRTKIPASAEMKQQKLCSRAESQLDEVRAIMRNGYKPSQFNRLHQRELRAIKNRGKYCQN